MIRLGLSGGAVVALTLVALSLHGPADAGSTPHYQWVVGIICASALAYLAGVASLLRRPPVRGGIWIVLLAAAAMRLPLLFSPPMLSTDIFRYVWDGRVQDAGINPYRYLPSDPALQSLRDDAVYPHINRRDYAPTIYPPAAQVLFAAIERAWPGVTGMKAMMVGLEALAMACLWRMLATAGMPRERLLIYAWNPLPVWAFAGNGHIDAAVVGFTALALWLRSVRRDGWAGLALGLAVASKLFPAVIAPALWRRGGGWRLAVAAAATVLGLYAVYCGVGPKVFGFLGGYGQEEGFDSGSGFWLLAALAHLAALPQGATVVYAGLSVLLLAALGAWFAFVRRPDGPVALCRAAGIMIAVLLLTLTPHYPWYYAWLAVPAVLAPSPAVIWLSAAPVLIYLDGYGDNFIWPTLVYAPAVLLAVPWRRWRLPGFRPVPIEGST
jgi:hypothetical protein